MQIQIWIWLQILYIYINLSADIVYFIADSQVLIFLDLISLYPTPIDNFKGVAQDYRINLTLYFIYLFI